MPGDSSPESPSRRYHPVLVGGSFLVAGGVVLVAGSVDIGTLPIGIAILAVGGLMRGFAGVGSTFRPLGVWLYVAGAFVIGQAIIFSAAARQATTYLVLLGIGFGFVHTMPVRHLSHRFDDRIDPYIEAAGARLGHWLANRLPTSKRTEN